LRYYLRIDSQLHILSIFHNILGCITRATESQVPAAIQLPAKQIASVFTAYYFLALAEIGALIGEDFGGGHMNLLRSTLLLNKHSQLDTLNLLSEVIAPERALQFTIEDIHLAEEAQQVIFED
jgi:hypothetical protein